jgi:hypothetical protein
MEDIDTGVNAQPQPSGAEDRNPTLEEFIQQRAEGLAGRERGTVAPEEPTEEEIQPEENAPDEESGVPEEGDEDQHGSEMPDEGSTDSELLQFLESATTEQIQELAQKGHSRLVSRIGELTKRAKQAEEQLARLQSQQQEEVFKDTGVDPSAPNPLSDIADTESLRSRKQEAEAVKEWADENLFRAEGSGADEVIVEANGRQFTKAEVRNALKMAERDLEKHIPEREKQIQEHDRLARVQKQSLESLRAQLPWMADSESDESKRLYAVLANPEVKKLQQVAPKFWAEFPVFAAHALNSIKQMQGAAQQEPQLQGGGAAEKKARPKPPSGPNTAAGAPRKTDSRAEAGLKRLEERVQKTKSIDDFISLRAAQLHNR